MRAWVVVVCVFAACSGSGKPGNPDQRSVTVGEAAPGAANGQPASAPAQPTIVGACSVPAYPGGACPPGTACSGLFTLSKVYAAGTAPTPIALGDLGNGKIDIVVGNSNSSVSILLGSGSGNYAPASTISLGFAVKDLALADFNNDGKLDLAVATGADVRVLLGNGNGTFQTPAKITATLADGLAVVQLDAGTTLDLVVYSYATNITPLIGNGDGTFTAGTSVVWTATDVQIATGDFNGDGHPDVVVANGGSGGVGIALNNGTGGLGAPIGYAVGAGRIAIGDVDRDGKLDVVQGTYVLVGSNNRPALAVARGNGDGTLNAPATPTFVQGGGDLAIGDADGDGKLDIAVTPGSTEPFGHVSMLFGNGDGTFELTDQYVGATTMVRPVIVDVSGDSQADLVVTATSANSVAVLLAATPSGCGTSVAIPTCGGGGTSCVSTSFCTDAFSSGTGTCPAGTQMTMDYGGTYACCPSGMVATSCNTDDPITSCSYTGTLPFGNGQGPCSDGKWCPTGTVCGATGECDPADHPIACGANGCLPGAACDSGTCGCPSGQPACGDQCCGAGAQCVNGQCVSSCTDSGFPTPCANSCCASGVACTNSACACPSDHPVTCGNVCCLSGADCTNGTCGCPSNRAACGNQCCASGEACVNGTCQKASSLPDSGGIPGCPSPCTNGAPGCGYCVSGQVQCNNVTGSLCCFTDPPNTCNGTCYASASCQTDPTNCGTVLSMGNPEVCDGIDQTSPCPTQTGMCCHKCLVCKQSGSVDECFIP